MPATSSHHSTDRLETRLTLLQLARDESNQPAWEELLTYYEPFVSKVLGSMGFKGADLDDARQQVSLRLWKGLKKYQRDPERAKFRTWFARLIRNTALNIFRSKQRQPDGPSFDDEDSPHKMLLGDDAEIEARVESDWQSYIVSIAMERARGVFSGHAVEVFTRSLGGESVDDIANQLHIKTNTVYILKHRMKTFLLTEIKRLKLDLETFNDRKPE